MPHGQPISIVRKTVGPRLRPIQETLERIFATMREMERIRKRILETRKDLEMLRLMDLPNPDNDKGVATQNAQLKGQRQGWLRDVYVPELKQIGITKQDLVSRLPGGVGLKGSLICLATGEVLFELLEGNAAFREVMPKEPLRRKVYVKLDEVLSPGRAPKEYVRDHFGRYTRRFAFIEKPWDVFLILLESGSLRGKAVGELKGDPFSKTGTVRLKYDFPESGQNPQMSVRELAFVNQEDGSTTQRALALGSTSNSLHGNEGYRFGKLNGVIIKIDLARIPENNDHLLVNLYCYEAQEGPVNTQTLGLDTFTFNYKKQVRDKPRFNALQTKQHTDTSTKKNRELMLLQLPLFAVCGVVFHDMALMQRHGRDVQEFIKDCGGTSRAEIRHEPHAANFKQEFFQDRN